MDAYKGELTSYRETVKIFEDQSTVALLSERLKKHAQQQADVAATITHILSTTSALDLQRVAPPILPTWTRFHSQFVELHQSCRHNVGYLHGRFKLFLTTILPYMAKNMSHDAPHSRQEKAQVLDSFTSISEAHFEYASAYLDMSITAFGGLKSLHDELAKYSSQRTSVGRDQMQNLALKLQELNVVAKGLFRNIKQSTGIETLTLSLKRLLSSSGYRKSFKGVAKNSELERFDDIKSEAVHVNYTMQVSQRQATPADDVRTSIASVIFDVSALLCQNLLFLTGGWLALRHDCQQLTVWLGGENDTPPPCLLIYAEKGKTIYDPLITAMEAYMEVQNRPPTEGR